MNAKSRKSAPPPRLLNVSEVAEICSCSTKQVRRWIDRGELVAHRLGRLIRIAPGDLDTFLKMRRD